jgi:hypothetical protein
MRNFRKVRRKLRITGELPGKEKKKKRGCNKESFVSKTL